MIRYRLDVERERDGKKAVSCVRLLVDHVFVACCTVLCLVIVSYGLMDHQELWKQRKKAVFLLPVPFFFARLRELAGCTTQLRYTGRRTNRTQKTAGSIINFFRNLSAACSIAKRTSQGLTLILIFIHIHRLLLFPLYILLLLLMITLLFQSYTQTAP